MFLFRSKNPKQQAVEDRKNHDQTSQTDENLPPTKAEQHDAIVVEQPDALEPVLAGKVTSDPKSSTQPDAKQSKRFGLGSKLARLFGAGIKLDPDTREQLELLLLQTDAGVTATQEILDELEVQITKNTDDPPKALQDIIASRLAKRESPLLPQQSDGQTYTLLIVGSNGSGKTTTLAKLANYYLRQGYKPILAAGDTFRAAAVEQLQHWSKKMDISCIAHQHGGDSAAVVFDAIVAAKARKCNLILADTAGRLHNKQQLLEELKKIHRIAAKADSTNQIKAVMVLDAATGASVIPMVRMFNQTISLSGLIVTKLDGSARGGSILALGTEIDCPVSFLGVGEAITDLIPFSANDYARRLLE